MAGISYPDTFERIYAPVDFAPITPSNGGRLDSVKARATDALGITYTAVTAGTAGNSITMTIADSAGATGNTSAVGSAITASVPYLGKGPTGSMTVGAGGISFVGVLGIGSKQNGTIVRIVKPVTVANQAITVTVNSDNSIITVTPQMSAATSAFAALTTALTGANNDVVYTSLLQGAYGNLITIEYVNPGVLTSATTVTVNNRAIRVNLAVNAGTKQVETATAAGTVTGSGNAAVTVTGSFIPNSPIVLAVPVTNTDTAAVWAEKVRTFLINTPAVANYVGISGTTTAIVGTRRIAGADDGTFNIALATGTATGITAAPTSANTTAGVAPAITSTAAQVRAAIAANTDAAALVSSANAGGNDGTGVVTALTATALTGGKHADAVSTVAQIATAINGAPAASALVTATATGTTSTVANANYSATLTGGIDPYGLTLGAIVGLINSDTDSNALVVATIDPNRTNYRPTQADFAAYSAPTTLAGGIAGQWDLPQGFARGLYVTGAGNVTLITETGKTRTIAVPANAILDLAFTGINSTNTTATGISGRA